MTGEIVDDPFGLRTLDVEILRQKRCAKWMGAPEGIRFASWVADMDFRVAPAIRAALREVIDGDEFGYPNWGGPYALSPAARLFPRRMSERYGWEPELDRVHELVDVLQGVRATILHLSQPGDGVVVHMPAYHPFLDTISSMSRRLVGIDSVVTADGVRFDYDRLEAELQRSPARIWILCHPHNPLGHVFDEAELGRIAEIAERHDLIVISDEIHADLTLLPAVHVPFASIGAEPAARTVTVTSPSKAFNLAGMRWAVLHAGCDAMQEALHSLPGHYLGAANQMAVVAAVAAWTKGRAWLEAVHAVLDENRHGLSDLLAHRFPGARYRPPDATYLAWVDLGECGLGDDPAAVFRQRGVEVSSGVQFGPQGAGHVRLNLATSPAILAATVDAMAG